jgi:hypothetical protein
LITIVSGLPRSGTSLMMQMLAAGGMPILSDGERVADVDNPRGYCEWERIKRLQQEPACLDEAQGKAVKVISQLLFALPEGLDYKIIFMERPLAEVFASQAEMIRRRGTSGASLPEAALIAGLRAHLSQVNAWLAQRRDIVVRRQQYHQVLQHSREASEDVKNFLDFPLDIEAMVGQVDPLLYRNREQPHPGNS